MNIFDLKNRVVLITGAAGHLGGVFAKAAVKAGAHVVLNGRKSSLRKLERHLTGATTVIVDYGDITDEPYIRKLKSVINKNFGRLDVIVNNAWGLEKAQSIRGVKMAHFDEAAKIAMAAPYLLIQEMLPLLKRGVKESGVSASVINVSTMYASVSPDFRVYDSAPSQKSMPFYGSAKAGLLQLTRYLACELAPENIRVNAMSPGPFPADRSNSSFIKGLSRRVPLGRIGRPEELSGAFLFLASEASSFVTGINLPIDGGWTAW